MPDPLDNASKHPKAYGDDFRSPISKRRNSAGQFGNPRFETLKSKER